MGEVASVRELVEWGRRPQRGLGLVAKILSVAAWASGREIKVQGESIAQRSQRPQRGTWGGWPKFYRWQRGRLGEKSRCHRGKHRTEVTEATEGDLGWVAKILSVAAWAFGREIRCNRKASHRGHGGHRGGFGVGGQNSIGGSVGVWARNQVQGESIAQRSRRRLFCGQRFYQQQGGRPGEN